MSYNYITDSHTNAVYKTTSPEGVKLIQRYMNQVGGADWTRRSLEQTVPMKGRVDDLDYIHLGGASSSTGDQGASLPNSLNILLQLIHETKDPLSHEVTRKRLIENIDRLPYGGQTPAQTLSRQLQILRDVGEIEFIARGVYKTVTKGGEETPPPMIEVHPQIISDIAKEIQVLSGLFGYGTLPEIQKRLSLLHEMMCSNIESLKCLQKQM